MPRPSHSSRFDHPNNIWVGEQTIKLLIVYFMIEEFKFMITHSLVLDV